MSLYVNDAGTWKLAKDIHVFNGATSPAQWKEPLETWINDNGTWKLVHKVISINTNTTDVNLFTLAGSPTSPLRLKVTIEAGVTVSSSNRTIPALQTGDFPTGSQILLTNLGSIAGAGGTGGAGASFSGATADNPTAGLAGGTAVLASVPITINNVGGSMYAGGGGGGGAAAYTFSGGRKGFYTVYYVAGSGGGGGAGQVVGAGGAGGTGASYNGGAGANGTSTTGGGGGTATNTNTGGAGGIRGASGIAATAAGGAGGLYISGNTNVTWVDNTGATTASRGTVLGGIA